MKEKEKLLLELLFAVRAFLAYEENGGYNDDWSLWEERVQTMREVVQELERNFPEFRKSLTNRFG